MYLYKFFSPLTCTGKDCSLPVPYLQGRDKRGWEGKPRKKEVQERCLQSQVQRTVGEGGLGKRGLSLSRASWIEG